MYTFDANMALFGFAIGLVAGGVHGLLVLPSQVGVLAPAVLQAAAAKWCIYLGLGGTILIWRKKA